MADPISAGVFAVGSAIASTFMGKSSAGGSYDPGSPPPMAAPEQSPVGDQNSMRKPTPSFVGASAVPQQQGFGQKTLLGQ